MPQDFAKPMSSRRDQAKPVSPLVWFSTGFAGGLFCAFLIWLLLAVPPDAEAPELTAPRTEPVPEPAPTQSTALELDFYEMFPKSEVPVVEEYLPEGGKRVVQEVSWMIQVGSFRDPADANSLRARLILEGFEVTAHPTPVEGKMFHRVVLGPIASEMEVARIVDRLDEAHIPSMRVKIVQ